MNLNKKPEKSESHVIKDEIYEYLEKIRPARGNNNKIKHYKKIPLDTIPEDKMKISGTPGLTDNIANDYENKDKARKGLLYLLNKLSGDTFCPEVKDYYYDLRENKELLNTKLQDKEKLKEQSTPKKRFNSVISSVIAKIDNGNDIIPEERYPRLNVRTDNKKEEKEKPKVTNSIQKNLLLKNKINKPSNEENGFKTKNKITKKWQDEINENELKYYYDLNQINNYKTATKKPEDIDMMTPSNEEYSLKKRFKRFKKRAKDGIDVISKDFTKEPITLQYKKSGINLGLNQNVTTDSN